jgi:hypothetical protein
MESGWSDLKITKDRASNPALSGAAQDKKSPEGHPGLVGQLEMVFRFWLRSRLEALSDPLLLQTLLYRLQQGI